MEKKHRKGERKAVWLVDGIKKKITELPGRYIEAAQLLCQVFCEQEKNNAREIAAPGAVA